MYLRELRIVNDGPLADVSLEVSFRNNRPLPLVIVGENGAGKSNLLSLIADAVIEGAAQHHSDILSGSTGISRPWFRVVGGSTIRRGQTGSFSILKFEEEGTPYFYKQKAGVFPTESLPADLSADLRQVATWESEGSIKEFSLGEQASRKIYGSGTYAFFPASRSETPHWLNSESLPDPAFEVPVKYDGRLGRRMFVEHGIETLGRWIASVLMDSRAELSYVITEPPSTSYNLVNTDFISHMPTLNLLNQMLKIVLNDPDARFLWSSRSTGLLFLSPKSNIALPLSALSSGQATLLTVFGTILMQCDLASAGEPTETPGLCLIDEIDAHVHIDLAYRAIPQLVALLPNVQFITSAHSPLYILGMQTHFGDEGFQLIELPTGRSIGAEGFSEFKHALNVLRDTQAFDSVVVDLARQAHDPLILCEGETDPQYLKIAAKVLDREEVLDGVTIDWIGKHAENGGSIGSGKDNLKRAWQLLTTNPELVARQTLLLFDNDVKRGNEDQGEISVRTMPGNLENTRVRDGIENLLNPRVFKPEMFKKDTNVQRNGTTVTTEVLRKMHLCKQMCSGAPDREDFEAFGPALDVIEAWKQRFAEVPQSGPEQGDEPNPPLPA